MHKRLLIVLLSIISVKSFAECDSYYLSQLNDITNQCAALNASFVSECIPSQGNILFGSASLFFANAGNNRSIVYCLNYSCYTGLQYGQSLSPITIDNECLPVTPPATQGTNGGTGPDGGGCTMEGSVIQVANQVIGENIPLVDMPFYLSHFSSRLKGRIADYTSVYQLTTAIVPPGVAGFTIEVADGSGTILSSTALAAAPDLKFTYLWDGFENGVETWGSRKRKITIKTNITSGSPVVDKIYEIVHGNFKAKKLGLGGWVPSNWHFYDSAAKKVYYGDGTTRNVEAVTEGSLQRVANADGSEVYYFDQLGRIVYTKAGLTGATLYTFLYRSDEKLLSIRNAFNKITKFNYDLAGKFIEIVSPTLTKTFFVQDAQNNITTVTNPKNEVFGMTYKNADGLMLTFTKPSGNVTTFTYDAEGKLKVDANSSGKSSTLLKTTTGVSATSAMGRVSKNFFNSEDGSETVTSPSGLITKYIILPEENSTILPYANYKTTFTDDTRFGSQVQTVTKYEETNFGTSETNIEETVDLSDLTNPFSINSISKVFNEGASELTSVYNGLTRTKTVTSKLGRTFTTQVDEFQRPILVQQGTFKPRLYTYSLDNINKITQNTMFFKHEYNATTKLLEKITDSEGQITQFTHDAARRLTSKTLPDGRVIYYTYDSNGNLTSITPPGRSAHQQYFGANEKISSYHPPGSTSFVTNYTYNNDRDLTKITRPDGNDLNFLYSSSTGLLSSTYGSFGSINREYSHERLSKITDQNSNSISLNYTGDVVSTMITKDSGQNIVAQYERTPLPSSRGKVASELITAGNKNQTINYGYDDDKYLTNAGELVLSYDSPNGSLMYTTLQNFRDEYVYDSSGRVRIFHTYFYQNNLKKLIYSYTLARDNIGRITSKTETYVQNALQTSPLKIITTTNFSYDAAGRLVSVTSDAGPSSTYTYDSNSNRTGGQRAGVPFTATYDTQDRLTSFNSDTYTYNLNGELLSKTLPSGTINYTYDHFGGLTLAGNVTYQIDALQSRSARLVNNVVTSKYTYNPEGKLVAEIDPQGNLQKTFVYATKSHVPDYFIDQNNEVFKMIVDHLGSVRLVMKASTGEIVQKLSYDEFGRVLEDSNPNLTPFGFAGGVYDSETKLVRFGVRDYDPETGRWLSKDPIRFNGNDTNLYGYVMQDPINFIDPSGLVSATQIGGGALTIVGGGVVYLGPSQGAAGVVGTVVGAGAMGLGVILMLPSADAGTNSDIIPGQPREIETPNKCSK